MIGHALVEHASSLLLSNHQTITSKPIHCTAEHIRLLYTCVWTLQSIQVETSTGQVQTALLLLCEMDDALAAHQRGAAMHDHNPFHSFMFGSQGHLLFANKAAARACRIDPAQSGESSDKPGRRQ